MCDCAEGKVEFGDDVVETGLHMHDCGYIRARDALIPIAVTLASKSAEAGSRAWARAFFDAMDELWERHKNDVEGGSVS